MDNANLSSGTAGLLSLPNELLIYILKPFSTQLLLQLTPTCHRLHDLILRILHNRLLLAVSPRDHTLILECYHPSAKSTEPYLTCEYLGTPGLNNEPGASDPIYGPSDRLCLLAQLGSVYSHFRPVRQEVEKRIPRPHPAGDVPGYQSGSSTERSHRPLGPEHTNTSVSHNVSLDSNELFSQLCVVAHLVQLGPRRGIFSNIVNVTDGVVRIWREWLAQRAASSLFEESKSGSGRLPESVDNKEADSQMLWVNGKKNAGIRVQIKERRWRRDAPILLHRDEDPAVSYVMEYKELRVRTAHLLRAVEQAFVEQDNVSGKAMIFGSFTQSSGPGV